jgi:hypothetical protein
MLRPVLRATSNMRSFFSLLLDTTPNIKCLQHRNTTSATLKNNVATSATSKHKHLQHLQTTSTTLRYTIATLKHPDQLLQHPRETITTPAQTICNT